MGNIIKLDKNLANQIAAGEVVERPLSIVKELVENSIDAGATNIKIEVFGGGIEKIIVTDDGKGIRESDLDLVVEKYSTSKIKNLQDLYNVMTFGFRGEAMSSISSVSNMEIVSKHEGEDFGNALRIFGGEKGSVEKVSFETGTKITIENLFHNTPARLNYLKKERTEYNHIFKYLQTACISYPEVGFEFYNEGKEIFQYRRGEDLKTRIYHVFSGEFVEQLLELRFDMVGMRVSGYISDPKFSYTNKNRQIIFVNKRPIKSPIIIKAIHDAYNRFIPHNTHPAYILNLEIDPSLVDVNVHPRKLEVRFAEEKSIFRIFYHAIEEKLSNVSLVESSRNDILSTGTSSKNQFSESNLGQDRQYYTGSGTKFKAYSPYKDTTPNPNQGQITDSINFSKEILGNTPSFEETTDLYDTKMGKIIGQFHNSYIVVETGNGIQILDQHALAERIIYEKLVHAERKIATQGLLLSESLHLTPVESSLLEEHKETFDFMGFEFEILQNDVIINAIPDFIKKENIKDIFLGIISDLDGSDIKKSKTLDEVKNKIFAYASCRAAIKFGHKLSLFEMNKLLNDAVADYSATCPHGRPVVYEIDLEELKGKYER